MMMYDDVMEAEGVVLFLLPSFRLFVGLATSRVVIEAF
jgi:hypothetical protein